MPIKHEEEQPFSAPAWIVTFSDMIGLLTSFFIMLLTYSTSEKENFHKLQGALQGEFGLIADPKSPDYDSFLSPKEALANNIHNDGLRRERDDLKKLKEQAAILVRKPDSGDRIEIERVREGLRLRLVTASSFAAGASWLNPDSQLALREVADLLRLTRLRFVVVGHTCVEGEGFQSETEQMRLAQDRALEAADYLATVGRIERERIAVAARADHDPVDAHATDEAIQRNRRLDILLLKDV